MTQITIVNVDVSSVAGKGGKKGYEVAEVTFKNDRGEIKAKKIVSFSNPAVYATIKEAKNGDQFDITQAKDANDYWQWTSIAKAGEPSSSPSVAATKPAGKVVGSTYETPEERAIKQRLIVRQSSLAQAISYFNNDTTPAMTTAGILEVAEQFTAWVYEAPDLFEQPNDIPY